ncbi:ECF-type sigma factor [Erythrobacter dokdonensis]|uniref:ECF sigma factor family protein n=1 Tax=Erythrobacter dokdonensis DSW-74 TaxID=1300349 RepID=A0A1A7BEB6_9SPHN|nr:ECF-type sigma factor [Erythrobacter dokdonensis]OBV10824.1 ECF sigma factor family protein [Erythrobacter dokdonensis DSW-74]
MLLDMRSADIRGSQAWEGEDFAGSIAYAPDERERAEALISEHYDTLIGIARAKRRRNGLSDTVSTVDLLHEAYVRIGGQTLFDDGAHFIRAVNLAMRHVIIDHARRKLADKRGGGERDVTLDERSPVLPEFSETPEELVGIAQLLRALEACNPRWLKVVDARYFGGMTEDETASVLGVSARTIRRDWTEARQWLARQMGLAAA